MNLEDVHWYFIDENNNDAQLGPFVLKDIKEKFLSGAFTPESYCWHEELEDWEKLKDIHFRGKPALFYLGEALSLPSETQTKPPTRQPVDNYTPSPIIQTESRPMTIEEEIKERLRKKFAK
ncbi:hypothetical protein SteCoe_29573 [Stentor coeruleus]|uniref:GYF domain-containing protein n=1 Tax=Stentor coeruleus TaxID=5963 RepID=A0A1R2B5N2_9CILI|nr:hypothetical protein SteCoe_29573 [Stentor coeruleus]